ncbi:MAG: peptidase S8, partial [Sphingobacteriales bacterium]
MIASALQGSGKFLWMFIIAMICAAISVYYYFRVIQFWQIPTEEEKRRIKSAGILLHQYLPNNAYMASVPVALGSQAFSGLGIRSVFPLSKTQKMSAALASRDYPAWAVTGTNYIDLVVQYYPTVAPAEAENMLVTRQIRVLRRYDFSRNITLRIPISQIEMLAQIPFISYLEPVDAPADPENMVGRSSHRSNAIATESAMGRKYNGQGVQVALGDDGIIGPHIDYQGRADQTNVVSNDGDHGDHVAGIIMGAGNRDPKGKGMAYGADLHVYDVWDAIDFTPSTYFTHGIRITSLSYGNGCNAGYTTFARTVDQQTRQMPALLHVFSAGNSGTTNCGYGAGSNWGNITGGVKQGKNVIAVANMTYTDGISGSSSRGPAKDGRIKPDISAVGTSVYSTVDINDYASKSGTSMACPGVSGTLAQ